ncbi:glycosyltransferase [Aliivibrio fischeri]|nr:glycosyltransferase [Aliivibrio fischeri]
MIYIIETVLIATSSITLLATITLLLAYKLKKDSNCKTELPLVSVFVPFFNEEPKLLLKALEHIELQNYPSQLQILLIDDGSDNNTIEHVEKWLAHPKK